MNLSSKQWNQGDLKQNPFSMQRQRASHEVSINAHVDRVFERTCVAGQPGWLRPRSVELVYSQSGANERYAMWSENETGPAVLQQPQLETFWTTTRIDSENHRCQAVLINPGLTVGTLDIAMEQLGRQTLVRLDLSCTALSESGSLLFDDELGTRLGHALQRFADTLIGAVAAESPRPVRRRSNQARRESATYEITISGNIDECFALACPVAELKWIDEWSFDLIYSASGRNETGCVFLEPSSGLSMLRLPGANTTWYTNRYDTERHVFEAVWVTEDLVMANFEARMIRLGGGQVGVKWSLAYTGLGEAGNHLLEESGLEERATRGMRFLATSLKHYVETGELFRLSSHRKLRVLGALIGAALGRRLRRPR